VAYAKGERGQGKGTWRMEVPGVQGQSPGRGSVDKVPPEAEVFGKIMYMFWSLKNT